MTFGQLLDLLQRRNGDWLRVGLVPLGPGTTMPVAEGVLDTGFAVPRGHDPESVTFEILGPAGRTLRLNARLISAIHLDGTVVLVTLLGARFALKFDDHPTGSRA